MKKYIKPKNKVREVIFEDLISMSSPERPGNGHHKGWDNPKNPHYGQVKINSVDWED